MFPGEAPPPNDATMHETLRYTLDEVLLRWRDSVAGLTNEDLSADPGKGAMSMGLLFHHELGLMRFMTNTLRPDPRPEMSMDGVGEQGAWNIDVMCERRDAFGETLHEVLASMAPEEFLEKRPDAPPEQWAEWPVLMRLLRPLTDLATHVGQVCYARRQLGKPMGK